VIRRNPLRRARIEPSPKKPGLDPPSPRFASDIIDSRRRIPVSENFAGPASGNLRFRAQDEQ
jgi:hypothetical protein